MYQDHYSNNTGSRQCGKRNICPNTGDKIRTSPGAGVKSLPCRCVMRLVKLCYPRPTFEPVTGTRRRLVRSWGQSGDLAPAELGGGAGREEDQMMNYEARFNGIFVWKFGEYCPSCVAAVSTTGCQTHLRI